MTAKEWLQRGWEIDRRIGELKLEKEQMFALATSTTGHILDDNIRGNGGNSSEAKMIKYTEYSQELDSQIDKLLEIKREILKAIKSVDDRNMQQLLTMRYITFKKFEQIAIEMNYSYRQVLRLHGEALLKIKDVIECHIDPML